MNVIKKPCSNFYEKLFPSLLFSLVSLGKRNESNKEKLNFYHLEERINILMKILCAAHEKHD
jgi:hypothetical protein